MARVLLAPKESGQDIGAVREFTGTFTADEATTSVMFVEGMRFGRVRNESGGAVTATFFDAATATGTALATFDEDNVAIPALVIADDGSVALQNGLAGCKFMVVTVAVAAILTFQFTK